MDQQPPSQPPATETGTNTPEAEEENGTQDVNTTTKAGQSYNKRISSTSLEAERKDPQAP